MVDYSKGKIYKIVVNNTDEEYRPYIGSTTKEYLSQRFTYHKSDYKKYKNGKRSLVASYNLFDKYGIENCEMVLIENYPCATKDELHARERYWFDNMENCNICKPIRTEQEVIDHGKLCYTKRIKQDPDCNKKHYQRQLELHPDRNEKHYQRQLELHPDYKEKYYAKRRELHPDRNEERKQNRYTCECGANIRREEKSRHEKSKKHLNYIATIATQQEV
jgi:hypothetical protein